MPALTRALKDKDTYVRQAAAQALGKIGAKAKAAVPALANALKDQRPAVRQAAAQALGQIGAEAKAAVPALRAAMRDNEVGEVRGAIAEAWKQIAP